MQKATLKIKKIPHAYKPEDLTYDEWQIALRKQDAMEQEFVAKNIGNHPVFSDFEVFNPGTNKKYKVAVRSKDIGLNFCSCPDFITNTLGTCKHVEFVMLKLNKLKSAKKLFQNPPEQIYSSIFLRYEKERKVALRIGTCKKNEIKKLAEIYFDQNLILKEESFNIFEKFIEEVLKLDENFKCYKDARDFIIEIRDRNKRAEIIDFKYPEGVKTPELNSLLKTELYPYQKEAILQSVKAGRIIIADEMGLGKTIQALAVTEIMAQEFGVEKVLIICPTSLKYQWKSEIEKFTNRSALVIEGSYEKRKEQYQRPEFFKILTYNAVKNDLENIKNMSADLIILDEAQRIKNWETKTAQTIKSIESNYAIVLTGTPIENKLEELHSIVSFVNPFMLGPLFRFLANHQILDKTNKVVGYKDLHNIKTTLSEILIRRRKNDVLKDLPTRIDKNCFVSMTQEQTTIHYEHYEEVCRLVNKWKRTKFLSEKERQMLRMNSVHKQNNLI